MKAPSFASHLFSATFLLVGVALVVGACSSKTKPGATESTGGAAVRPAAGGPSNRPVMMAIEPGRADAVSPALHQEDNSPVRTVPVAVPVAHDTTSGAERKSPAKTYDPLFEGWGKPLATLCITGRQEGYIEPCGCTGLTNQKGGLNRKFTLYRQLDERGWNPVALDVGNQVRRFGRQAEIKFQTTIDGFRQMGYRAIGLGPDDLRLSFDELLSVVAPAGGDETKKLFVCANVDLWDMNARYLVIPAGGQKIGVTAILGAEKQKLIRSNEITMTTPDAALAEVWPQLEAQKCDAYVLLAHTSIEDSKRLAEAFPGFHIVATAGGFGEPTFQPDALNGGKTWLIQVGTKGMYVGVLGIFDDPDQPLRYQKVTLDARFPDAQPMMDLMSGYQQQLEALGLDGLDVKPRTIPSGRKFVGSTACADCHSIANGIWEETPHFHATQTLVKPPERYQVSRHHDPECLACHVVGWDPQGYFPYESGYASLKSDEGLHGVGCENCHGPGSRHVDAENGDIDATEAELKAYQQEMVLKLDAAEDFCKRCHDLDNSPDFHAPDAFNRYWKKVEHYGKD